MKYALILSAFILVAFITGYTQPVPPTIPTPQPDLGQPSDGNLIDIQRYEAVRKYVDYANNANYANSKNTEGFVYIELINGTKYPSFKPINSSIYLNKVLDLSRYKLPPGVYRITIYDSLGNKLTVFNHIMY